MARKALAPAAHTKTGAIQGLPWALRREDTQIHGAFHVFKNKIKNSLEHVQLRITLNEQEGSTCRHCPAPWKATGRRSTSKRWRSHEEDARGPEDYFPAVYTCVSHRTGLVTLACGPPGKLMSANSTYAVSNKSNF